MTERGTLRSLAMAAVLLMLPYAASAQTDYYNTDSGRPIRVEDAYPVEYRAFELQLTNFRLERSAKTYTWGFEPEVAFGILPRTHVEVGLPLALIDAPASPTRIGLAGVELSVFHNLNVETRIPALAIVGDVLLPAGSLGPKRVYPSVKGIATKTFNWMRFHANGQYTFGDAPSQAASGAVHLSRWVAGVAADKPFPLRSLLLAAEVVAEQPLEATQSVEWSAATGARKQWGPRWAVDAGFGLRLNQANRPWFITAGGAYAFGLPWYPRR